MLEAWHLRVLLWSWVSYSYLISFIRGSFLCRVSSIVSSVGVRNGSIFIYFYISLTIQQERKRDLLFISFSIAHSVRVIIHRVCRLIPVDDDGILIRVQRLRFRNFVSSGEGSKNPIYNSSFICFSDLSLHDWSVILEQNRWLFFHLNRHGVIYRLVNDLLLYCFSRGGAS